MSECQRKDIDSQLDKLKLAKKNLTNVTHYHQI